MLSSALKPRALWVAAHHLELSGRMDGLWSALLNALADLVSGNEAEVDARRSDSCVAAMQLLLCIWLLMSCKPVLQNLQPYYTATF